MSEFGECRVVDYRWKKMINVKGSGDGNFSLTAKVSTSIKMTEIYRSIFKNILTKNPMKNVKVAIPILITAISENLFQNGMSLARET
jgi:hypothetical protein